jgi:hypothetical protein
MGEMTRRFLEREDSGDGVIFRLLFGEASSGDLRRGEIRITSSKGNDEFISEQNKWIREQNEEMKWGWWSIRRDSRS